MVTDPLSTIRQALNTAADQKYVLMSEMRVIVAALAACDALEAEREELTQRAGLLVASKDRAAAECARLRAALERIDSPREGMRDWHSDIARAALEQGE